MRGEESWQGGGGGGRWLQTHVTSDTGPQCPSVNSMCVCPHSCLCVCVVQYCIVQPLGSCGWWPLYVALLSHPFTSHCFACHTHRNTHRERHTQGAWPAMSLKSQEAQMWQQINVVWPRSTHRSTHTHTQGGGLSSAALHTTETLKTINGTCNTAGNFRIITFNLLGLQSVVLSCSQTLSLPLTFYHHQQINLKHNCQTGC